MLQDHACLKMSMRVEVLLRPFHHRLRNVCRVAIYLFCAMLAAPAVIARPAVMVTVDVESFDTLPLPQQVNASCASGDACGLNRIMQMLEERHMKGTFFLNVYEHAKWGQDVLRGMTADMQRRGHDVALHTHPQWAYDAQRPYMYEYSAADQKRIIADGVRALQEWTGLPVVAHRAGAYSADRATIEALADSGVIFDSSLFLHHPRSRLNALGLPSNVPSMIGSVIEVPVTVYERHERPPFPGKLVPPHIAIGKLDVDSISTPEEAVAAFDAMVAADPPIIVLFLHSFSLMTVSAPEPATMPADMQSMEIYRTLLDRIAAQELQVVTSRDVVTNRELAPMNRADKVPVVALVIPLQKYAVRMVRAWPIACAVFAVLSVAALSGLIIAWRRRRAQPQLAGS